MKALSAFDVFSHMARTNNVALRLAPLSNIDSVDYNHKKGTVIKIGFPGNIAMEFAEGNLLGGLILVQKSEFEAAKQQAENEREDPCAVLRNRVLRNANGIDRALAEGQDPVELLQNLKLALLASVDLE